MIFILGECHRNSLLASRVYKERYPDRRPARPQAFTILLERFIASGQVRYCKCTRTRTVLNENNEFNVMVAVVENPHMSSRKLSSNLDISRSSVQRIIKKNKFHPYHIQLQQELSEQDFRLRIIFSQWLLQKMNEDCNFSNKVIFTDEATFHNNGAVNKHNLHYYSDINPHWRWSINRQQRWSINVWGAVFDSHVIGPYFFDGTVSGHSYLNFLSNHLIPLLPEDLRLNVVANLWYQHDGAAPHYAIAVRRWLNEYFPNKWIGRGGPVTWPPRSPDLTPMDYFLWGFVKDHVYQERPTTVDNMKMRIRNAFASITPQMMANVRASLRNRVNMCIQQNGNHFEHLLN